ncbi:sigma-54 dependent transcriptional regulator [Geobacter pelophilus]|uniref:Sigma-54 dependent transcriptional regulator n=1 Tax=Geoanaerobacter pelophilus TaxID=60036 RepID=A0AAW4L638_9BACT|nr:sigma-54 dependent transcriptional regulator [Geoanaerobacter pelophilus]MBT0666466.1 sigma-54 dependent transcriptional regulator [Geoanaerobacter pelophilus]
MTATILIVEDDVVFRELLTTILDGAGYTVTTAADGGEGLRRIQRERFDLVLCDLKMPVRSGLDLFRVTRSDLNAPLFIFITAFGRVEEAVSAIKEGAFDFLSKPLKDPASLLATVQRALEQVALERLTISLKEVEQAGLPPEDLIFAGRAMESVRKLVQDVARTTANVLLHGESGTGKELIAKMIHLASPRRAAPFVPLNCAAIPENLLESELFGHERGAFTGAAQARRGKFELAQGGTIFLDEIGEMPMLLQAKLLRVLQERTFERLGGSIQIKADVRVIAASNRDLAAEVAEKSFREDLFYRLNVFPITLPPLRERIDAIPALVRHFCARFSASAGVRRPIGITADALLTLQRHTWPGNVRELQNVIERAVILARGEITVSELPETLQEQQPAESCEGLLKHREKETIQRTLQEFKGNRRKTAEALGISLRTLQYRIKELGLLVKED